MPNITIKRAEVSDANTVAKLVHALLDELSGGKAQPVAEVEAAAARLLADGRVIALIAEVDGAPAAIITLNECAAIYVGGLFGEICELYVAPDMRSHGLAPRLLAAAEDEGRARGWRRFEVGAPDQPVWSRTFDFYIKEGFEEVGPRLRRAIKL